MVHEGMHAKSLIIRSTHRSRFRASSVLVPIALLLLSAAAAATDDESLETIRIAVQDRSALALLHWAEARGDFAKESLQPEFSIFDQDSFSAVSEGKLDLIAGGADTLLQAATEGLNLRGALILAWSVEADAILASAEVRNVLALRGSNIAIVDGNSVGSSEVLLSNALQQRGLNLSRVTLSYMDEEQAVLGIQSGEIEALVAGEPALGRIERTLTESLGTLARLVDPSRDPGMLADVLMGEERWLRSNKETAKSVIRVWDRVVRAQRRDPTASTETIAQVLGVEPEQAQQVLERSRLFDTNDNIETLRGEYQKAFGEMSLVLQNRDQRREVGRSAGRDRVIIRGVPSSNRYFDFSPLRQVVRGR